MSQGADFSEAKHRIGRSCWGCSPEWCFRGRSPDLAALAQVDSALVMQYFGSKDKLFALVADFDLMMPDLSPSAVHFPSPSSRRSTRERLPWMDVAKVGIGDGMPQLSEGEVIAMLGLLLELIDDWMPDHLQRQDPRVQQGRALRDFVLGLPAAGLPRRP